VVMFVGPFERFGVGDLNRIRQAEAVLTAGCVRGERQANASVETLVRYFGRDPDQLLPLVGATPPSSMRDQLTGLEPSLREGACVRYPALGTQVSEALAGR